MSRSTDRRLIWSLSPREREVVIRLNEGLQADRTRVIDGGPGPDAEGGSRMRARSLDELAASHDEAPKGDS